MRSIFVRHEAAERERWTQAVAARVIVLSKSGAFKDLIAKGESLSWLPKSADPVFVVIYDSGGLGGYNIGVAPAELFLPSQAGGEGDSAISSVATTPVVLSASDEEADGLAPGAAAIRRADRGGPGPPRGLSPRRRSA